MIIFKYHIKYVVVLLKVVLFLKCVVPTKLIFYTVLKLLKLIFSSVKVCIFADLSFNWACKS